MSARLRFNFGQDCDKCGKFWNDFFYDTDDGICSECSDHKKIFKIKLKFFSRITELGGEVLGKYKRKIRPIKCRCIIGHSCQPSPNNIEQGKGMCRICAGYDHVTAKEKFITRIIELGGEVLGKYINSKTPVACMCQNGHRCQPTPHAIWRGKGGICKICAGHDSLTAQTNFKKRITELGGEILGPYIKSDDPIKCQCVNGHFCYPRPSDIRKGYGMCSSCGLKSEPLCRKIFEELGFPMVKIRPSWLRWRSGYPLELDGYNEEKKIAFEYQGAQHYFYNPRFHHNGPEDLEDLQERDRFKVKVCSERGIQLICVPHNYSFRNPEAMRSYIISNLKF